MNYRRGNRKKGSFVSCAGFRLGNNLLKIGNCPYSKSLLSMPQILSNLAAMPSDELLEQGRRQRQAALGTPDEDVSLEFTPGVFLMRGTLNSYFKRENSEFKI